MGTVIEIIRVRNTTGTRMERWLYRVLRAVCGTWFNHVAVRLTFETEFEYFKSPVETVLLPPGVYVSEFRGRGHELTFWNEWQRREPSRVYDVIELESHLSKDMILSHVQTVRRWSTGYERLALPLLFVGIYLKKVLGFYPWFFYPFISVRKFYCSDHAAYLLGLSPNAFYPLDYFHWKTKFAAVE